MHTHLSTKLTNRIESALKRCMRDSMQGEQLEGYRDIETFRARLPEPKGAPFPESWNQGEVK